MKKNRNIHNFHYRKFSFKFLLKLLFASNFPFRKLSFGNLDVVVRRLIMIALQCLTIYRRRLSSSSTQLLNGVVNTAPVKNYHGKYLMRTNMLQSFLLNLKIIAERQNINLYHWFMC